MKKSNMYANAETWSVFKGCAFACTYCVPSFQRQAKRQMHVCSRCYAYEPHEHPERLTVAAVPGGADIVFVAGNGDIAFADATLVPRICEVIKIRNRKHPNVVYYLQSKRPECFAPHLAVLPPNVMLVTTLETNRDDGYSLISTAPPPSVRHRQFAALDYPRKVVTIEPVMAFDLSAFVAMIETISPEYVWLGINSRSKQVAIPQPSSTQFQNLAVALGRAGIEVRLKLTPGSTSL